MYRKLNKAGSAASPLPNDLLKAPRKDFPMDRKLNKAGSATSPLSKDLLKTPRKDFPMDRQAVTRQ